MRYRRITGGVIFGVCLALFLYFSPVLKPLPQPSGPYAVGIQSFFTADEQRADPYAKTKENRKIVGHIWYPAVPATGKRYEYLGDAMQVFKKIFAQEYHIPGFLSEVLWRGIPTHAYSNATIASTQHAYPVILFSHGLLGLPSQFYSSIIQNIVSHGYIVVGIDHPYFNLVTYYPYGIWVTSNNLATQFHTMKPHEQEAFQMKAIGVYKADMSFVIDYIKHLNEDPESLFYKRCDLNKLIVMGHSAGGTAAIEFCRHDVRCKGAIDLDGWYDQAIDHSPLDKPLLLVFAEKSIEVSEPSKEYLARKELTREQYYQREEALVKHKQELCSLPACSMVVIPNADHGDFGDNVLLKWPLRGWHEVEPYETLRVINEHIMRFLQNYFPVT